MKRTQRLQKLEVKLALNEQQAHVMVTDANGVRRVGRYGWKADIAELRDMIATALDSELGITNPIAENIKQHAMRSAQQPKLKLDDDGSMVNSLRDYLRALTLEPAAPQ